MRTRNSFVFGHFSRRDAYRTLTTLVHLKLKKKVICLQKLWRKMQTCLLIFCFWPLRNVSPIFKMGWGNSKDNKRADNVLSNISLNLMHNILAEWKQGTKMATCYSSRRGITFGVPQSLILQPLLFNIFLYELVFLMKDMDFVS